MNTLKINVRPELVKALLLIAGKQDVRYYLNGVCVDFRTPGRVHLVATDGHRLMIADVTGSADGGLPERVTHAIIPRDMLESVKTLKGADLNITLIADEIGAVDVAVQGITTATGKEIDGKYPDWKRLIPRTSSGAPAQFNAAYIGDWGKVAKLLGNRDCIAPIAYNGEAATLVGLPGDCIGIQMPVRSDMALLPTVPEWIDSPVASEAAAA
jgi:DNA polymerase-3 subunit beta